MINFIKNKINEYKENNRLKYLSVLDKLPDTTIYSVFCNLDYKIGPNRGQSFDGVFAIIDNTLVFIAYGGDQVFHATAEHCRLSRRGDEIRLYFNGETIELEDFTKPLISSDVTPKHLDTSGINTSSRVRGIAEKIIAAGVVIKN